MPLVHDMLNLEARERFGGRVTHQITTQTHGPIVVRTIVPNSSSEPPSRCLTDDEMMIPPYSSTSTSSDSVLATLMHFVVSRMPVELNAEGTHKPSSLDPTVTTSHVSAPPASS
jgi:hypothetical protein